MSWLRLNLARGCSEQVLFDRLVQQEGFAVQDVLDVLSSEHVMSTAKTKICIDSGKKSATRKILAENNTGTANSHSEGNAKKRDGGVLPLNNDWKEWIRIRLEQGTSKEEIFWRCCCRERLNLDQVCEALGGYRARPLLNHETPTLPNRCPYFTKRSYQPRAWRLDTELVELYEIPNFLCKAECEEAKHAIDNGILQRSIVTNRKQADSRTSQTCHLRLETDNTDTNDIVTRIEQKLNRMMGGDYDQVCAEPLQGQVYGVGDFFEKHTDWFAPNTEEYHQHCQERGGQRTWTVMVYLNSVEDGGETKFELIEREFVPRRGTALAWNNFDSDGVTPNQWTLHEAQPVAQGKKYVLTKWFRERSMA